MQRVSFVIPVYNNFKYTKHIYENLKLYYPDDEIVISDGGSTDETTEYFSKLIDNDSNLVFISNDKLNLCENYNIGVDSSTCDIIILLHNDMFIPPNFKQRLLSDLDKNTIVSYARIEPPVFPGEEPGKVVRDFGFDLETLNREKIIKFSETYDSTYDGGGYLFIACYRDNWLRMDEKTFNPPQMWTADDDLHIRFRLANFKLTISNAIVYHFVSKTSRSDESYKQVEYNSNRNYVRKWGTRSDAPKYNIGIRVTNCTLPILDLLEPYCDRIYIDDDMQVITSHYLDKEQPNTKYDLTKRVLTTTYNNPYDYDDIVVEVDAKRMSQQDTAYIFMLPQIIQQSGEVGTFRLGNLKITIQQLETYEKNLIYLS